MLRIAIALVIVLITSCAEHVEEIDVDTQAIVSPVKSDLPDNTVISKSKPQSPLDMQCSVISDDSGPHINVRVTYRYPAQEIELGVIDAEQNMRELSDPIVVKDAAAGQVCSGNFFIKPNVITLQVYCRVKTALGEKTQIKTLRLIDAPVQTLRTNLEAASDVFYQERDGQRVKLAPASAK